MNRWYLVVAAVPAVAVIAASCTPPGGSPPDTQDTDSGAGASPEDGGSTPPVQAQDSGSGVTPKMDSGGGGGGPVDTGTPYYPPEDASLPDAALPCVFGFPGPTSLPFHVDQYFVSSGWEQPQYIQAGPPCTRPASATVDAGTDGSVSDGGEDASVSDGGASGDDDAGSAEDAGISKCWSWTYSPGGLTVWAGVDWQYPLNNWGTQPGLAGPPGATAVTFYAWGLTGTEIVTFNVGYGASSTDVFGGSLPNQQLTRTPTLYTIPLTGDNYVCNSARMGFGWTALGPSSETFFIDSITWQ